jgi:hypothetical protein
LGDDKSHQAACNDEKDTFHMVEMNILYLTTFKDDLYIVYALGALFGISGEVIHVKIM